MGKRLKYLKKYNEEAFFTPPPPTTTGDVTKDLEKDKTVQVRSIQAQKQDKAQAQQTKKDQTISFADAMKLSKGESGKSTTGGGSEFTGGGGGPVYSYVTLGKAKTTSNDVYYNLGDPSLNAVGVQSNLPTLEDAGVKSHYLKGTKNDMKRAISEGRPVFYYFKYITESEAIKAGRGPRINNAKGTDITDFLKIGGKKIGHSGGKIEIDLSDGSGDEEIVASGNGLLLLIRTAANNQFELNKGRKFIKVNILHMKAPKSDAQSKADKETEFEDSELISIKTRAEKQIEAELITAAFELTSEYYDTKLKGSPGKTTAYKGVTLIGQGATIIIDGKITNLRNSIYDLVTGGSGIKPSPIVKGDFSQRDENVANFIEALLVKFNDFYINYGIGAKESHLKSFLNEDVKRMSKEDIKGWIKEFRKTVDTEDFKNKDMMSQQVVVNDFMKKFLKEATKDYLDNFKNYVEEKLEGTDFNVEEVAASAFENLEKELNKFCGGFKSSSHVDQIVGKEPGTGGPLTTPTKEVEKAKTENRIGNTSYVITKESFKFLKSYESFKFLQKNKWV